MSRLSHSRPAPARADGAGAGETVARWRAFLQFQALFWSAFFLLRLAAASIVHPEVLWTFMGPRIVTVCVYAGATTVVHVVVSRLSAERPLLRLAAALALCAAFMGPIHAMETAFQRAFAPQWPGAEFLEFAIQFGWVFMMWAGYYYAQDLIFLYRKQTADLARAQAAAHGAQLKMLRYQLNPHFLFNTLNAISTLVLEKRNADAEAMILRLSRFLRHTLDANPDQFSRLDEEEEIQKLYLMVEAQRFGDRLRIVCDIPDDLHDCLVPSLMIQPAIENAIKHGVGQIDGSGFVRIMVRRKGARLITK